MKRITNPVEMMDRLMSENEQVLFNLFLLIAGSENSFWVSDERSYIIGQTDENKPMWVYIKDTASNDALGEIEQIISQRLELNPALSVTGSEKMLGAILSRISKKTGAEYKADVPMVIYRCDNVIPRIPHGRMILSDDSHRELLARFISGMIFDLAGRTAPREESEGFANDVAGSPDLFLWEDGEEVVAMAMITHRAHHQARINTVYTDSAHRGKGYAGMLVGTVTQKILDEGLIPMLYTESDNVCSNAAYKRIGYTPCGELTHYTFVVQG